MHEAPKKMSDYHKELQASIDDKFLRQSLDNFAVAYKANRKAIFEEIDERGLIQQIADSKDKASKCMEELYVQFKEEAEKRGAIVHRVATAAAANELISRIAKENNVKVIAKSKSMTSEETQLNKRLEADNFTVVETDLGEWIIQLRKEGPSHMVMPAIHLSRFQIAEDFSKVTGSKQEPDIQGLVKVSRAELRPEFIKADMGISGANFAISENGTFATITNEGNARMVMTLPKVHVALIGLDKLIPTIDDALTAMLVLPRNATAQRLTSYVTWVNGASDCAITPTGKKILHIVFLDNGRSALAKDPMFSEVLRCVRCGACANVCPVYRLVGGHKMGYIYIGAIGLILTYLFHGREKAKFLVQNCINCGACKTVCASGIDLPKLIYEIRARINEEEGTPIEAALLSTVMKNRTVFHSLLKFAKFAQLPSTVGSKFQRHLPAMFVGGQEFRALPALAPKSFRQIWKSIKPSVPNPRFRVALFSGCAQDFIYPEQLTACVKLLAAHNVEIDFPLEQTCCGLPLDSMGQRETAISVAQQNVHAFDVAKYDAIITLCASCGSHLKHRYIDLLEGTPSQAQAVHVFVEKITDFSSFVYDILGLRADDFNNGSEKVTYHAACHLCRGLEVTVPPRELIKAAGEYVPCVEEDVCCGFGGTYSMKFPEVSSVLLEKKLADAEATGATRLVVDCPGCVMQIKGGFEKKNSKIKVTHISELLAERMK